MTGQKPDAYPSVDWILRLMVATANTGIGTGITLIVDGVVITGTLISETAYFRRHIEVFEAARGPDDTRGSETPRAGFADSMTDAMQQLSETAARRWSPENDLEDRVETIDYLHLKDARIFTPGQPLKPNTGMLWRFRLTEVSGYSVGVLTSEYAESDESG